MGLEVKIAPSNLGYPMRLNRATLDHTYTLGPCVFWRNNTKPSELWSHRVLRRYCEERLLTEMFISFCRLHFVGLREP